MTIDTTSTRIVRKQKKITEIGSSSCHPPPPPPIGSRWDLSHNLLVFYLITDPLMLDHHPVTLRRTRTWGVRGSRKRLRIYSLLFQRCLLMPPTSPSSSRGPTRRFQQPLVSVKENIFTKSFSVRGAVSHLEPFMLLYSHTGKKSHSSKSWVVLRPSLWVHHLFNGTQERCGHQYDCQGGSQRWISIRWKENNTSK